MNAHEGKYCVLTIACGIVLVAGFFSAARLHFSAIELGISAQKFEGSRKKSESDIKLEILRGELLKRDILLLPDESNALLRKFRGIELNVRKLESRRQSLLTNIEVQKRMAEKYANYGRLIVVPSFLVCILIITGFVIFTHSSRRYNLVKMPVYSSLFRATSFLFSNKNQREVFGQIVVDWQEEYFDALRKKEFWKVRWINVRYGWAFVLAMWQKSPIGDLIEFIMKVAK